MAKILCVSNQKGGVGKTTTTNALAMGLRHLGRRVLCVDFDPQGDLSFGLRADNRIEMQNSVYHALKGELLTVQTIQHTPYCDVIPSNMLLSGIELEFTGKGREYLLRSCLKPVLHLYDNILIDSPPALGILTVNAFTAADTVLMPVQPDIFSLQGLVQLNGTLDEVRRKSNPNVQPAGVLLTRFVARENASRIIREAAKDITKQLGIPLLDTTIRNSNTLTTAQINRADVMAISGNKAVEDYRRLLNELIHRGVL
ncbi:MAG: ParA family protein [Oscillospiraceae bacterium]|jgi:chromosome partitioning protein|nr:ParA family protein [Oscillospiraceae bacterium]